MVLYYARLYDLAGIELTRAKDAAPADFEDRTLAALAAFFIYLKVTEKRYRTD